MKYCGDCGTEMPDDAGFCPDCGVAAGGAAPATNLTVGAMETMPDGETRRFGPSTAGPQLKPGERFADRYEIIEKIGEGGMGVVYKASDSVSNEVVALKLIRTDRISGERAMKRLIEEGLVTRKIRHPNIIAVYDVGEVAGQPFVSMEYVEGRSLRAWHREMMQKREDVPLRVAARIIAETLDGLKVAHDAGVIHRDLKPENIILAADPTETAAPLKILDFGIARATGGAADTGTGTGLGTPRYMAPEQITNPDTARPAADLYSLSVMFYELLVDVLPQGHWQPPSDGRSDVPAGIDKLIEQGLSNRPNSRPQSAEEYREQLVSAVNLGPSPRSTPRPKPAPIPAPSPRPAPQPRSSGGGMPKWLIWGGGALGALVVLGGLSQMIPRGGGSSGGRTTVRESPAAEVPPVTQQQMTYADLSGAWYAEDGSRLSMQVDNSGNITGNTNYDGLQIYIQGGISGRSVSMSFGAEGIFLGQSRGNWDGTNHIFLEFETLDGSQDSGTFHINHRPH